MSEKLVRVVGAGFCAGIVVVDGKVAETAPFLWYLRGKTEDEARSFVYGRGWRATVCR